MYPLCCPQPLCIHGNSCLHGSTTGNRQWLKQTGFWSSLWETYIHFCLLLTNESWDSIWIVSLLYWNEVPRERSTSFVDSYWVSWQFLAVLHLLLNSSQIHFVFWQFWTIICMVFRTILILHSLTQCCVVSCFLWVFLSNLSIQILCIELLMSSLFLHFAKQKIAWLFCKESGHVDFLPVWTLKFL